MAISISSIGKAVTSSHPIALIYGVAGVGKTSLAAEAPAPVFIQIDEAPPAGMEIDTFGQLKTYDEVIGAIGALYGEAHEYQTVIIDSLAPLEKLVWEESCRRNSWQNIEDPGFGKGYVVATDTWKELLGGLKALRDERGMNVIMLGHTDISRFDSPTTDPYSRYRVNLHKRAADTVEAIADVVAFINYRVSIKKADVGFNKTATHAEGGGTRVIYTEERPGFIAKNRYGMPAEVTYKRGEGWSALAAYFPKTAE